MLIAQNFNYPIQNVFMLSFQTRKNAYAIVLRTVCKIIHKKSMKKMTLKTIQAKLI